MDSSSSQAPRVRWYWKDDSGWKKYSIKDSDIIEQAYETGVNTVNVVNGQYTISIKDRTQTKNATGFEREIIRGSWFWMEGDKSEPYSEDAAATLELAFRSQQWGKKIEIGGSYYVKLNSDLISHRQHRNHGGNPAGRRVQRGYKGKLGKSSNKTSKQLRLIIKPNHNTANLKSRIISVYTKGDVVAQVKLQINLKFGVPVANITSFLSSGGVITTSNHILALSEDSIICYVLSTDPPLPSKLTPTTEAKPSTDSIDFANLSYTELLCFIKATEEMLAQAKAEKEKRDKTE